MTGKELRMLSLATVCGFIGGSVANEQPVKAASDILRASRFELVDESGRRIGVWGRDQAGHTAIAFTGKGGNELAALGVRSDCYPFLDMAGADGKVRVTLRLESGDKPLLGMGDEKWEGRVLLGSIAHDTSEPSDEWGLLFRGPVPLPNLHTSALFQIPEGPSRVCFRFVAAQGRVGLRPSREVPPGS